MKSLLPAGLALALIAQPVAAQSHDDSAAMIRSVVNGCRPDSAFGFKMHEPYDGGRMMQLKETAAPFNSIEVIATVRSKTLVGVDLWGALPEDSGTVDERWEAATVLLEEIDAAVEESGRFTDRTWDEDNETIVYSRPVAAPESTVRMELSQLGVSVIVSCADETRRQLALDEYLGRTRVDRPVRPVLPTPVHAALAECDDPDRAEAIFDAFEAGGGYDVMNVARASNDYFEHLTQWYGQELMDKGVWTEEQRDAFQLSFLEDEIIMGGLEQQMARLGPLMELPMQMIERREAGDAIGSCRAVIGMVELVADMGRTNEAQWNRATSLYLAEAARLGVTLEE